MKVQMSLTIYRFLSVNLFESFCNRSSRIQLCYNTKWLKVQLSCSTENKL